MIELQLTLQRPASGGVIAPRALHLVDVENLLGGTTFTEGEVAAVAPAYAAAAEIGPSDLVVIASSHFTAPAAWFGWGNARRIVRSGPDGADLALIEIIETENVAARFERVVIGSGDGIFAHSAARLQANGVKLTIVTRRDSLSRQLRLASRDIRYLNVMTGLAPYAAQRVA